ncbi:alpha/beta fold hydrolase [Sphingomonas sanxanigenens]|uniref:AB hydrolase-1 domain-containing protein n=1 Tax=Sphingomonas sanxanigenens DSM 19645 = NX02 TaxID=1123269 RepID=W0A7Y9_9SPHN|nr:alpha/beta fold hydrolase [Sphingomonas sanxanigenens]AHE51780.1 hypothetical protein NX02_00055 [Sphingomonas sanxanigenens DSM 19645 = NX02]
MLDYGGSGPPVVFIPSLINPAHILDIAPHNSMLRWLSAHGIRPLLVDWGTPTPAESGRDIAGHVEDLLVPLIAALGERPALVGYCLGGTMAVAAATMLRPRGLALIAAPWRFAGFPERSREEMSALWSDVHDAADAMGLLPIEVLQAAFWRLDPDRVMQKFAGFAELDPASDAARAFVTLEDWANAGAPLTWAAGRDLFDDLIYADLPGRGRWRVGGAFVDPSGIDAPILDIVSTCDRIVPAATALGRGTTRLLNTGHVGMVVGRRAREQLWHPLLQWLSQLPASC